MSSWIKAVRAATALLFLLALFFLDATRAGAQLVPLAQDQGANGLGLALRHLPVSGSVLYVTAHPDDENNGVLVKLNRTLGLRTGLLTLTRGEGGQNEIGSELFEALGVLRTEELAGTHRYDAAEQYFSRAYEFGYSFSVEESFDKWGREETLRDVVRVVRRFRPDVILTLSLEAPGGGQHHQAAARIAVEAFRAAADPTRFPEQIAEGLRPWQARKIYQGGTGGGSDVPRDVPAVVVPTSEYDPLLGMSPHEFGALGRASHKCQGAGQLRALPGTGQAPYLLVDSEPKVAGPEADILAGVDTSVASLVRFANDGEAAVVRAGLGEIEAEARRALAVFDAGAPQRALPPVMAGLSAVRRLQARVAESRSAETSRTELLDRLALKEADFQRAALLAQGLTVEVTTDDDDVVRGQSFGVLARLVNRGAEPVRIDEVALALPPGWTASATEPPPTTADLVAGGTLQRRFTVTVAKDARYTQPYWKRNPAVDRVDVEIPQHHTLPWSPPEVTARVKYTTLGVRAAVERPAWWRYEGRWVGGEKQKVVNVVPALSVAVSPGLAVFPTGAARARRELRVNVRNGSKGAAQAAVRLEVPPGFSVEPQKATLAFRFEGEELASRFFVRAPARLAPGELEVRAVATLDGVEYREGVQVIVYDHIQERHLLRPARAAVKAVDVAVAPGATIGYVAGSGDEVPAAMRQLGVEPTLLTPDDLAYGDLSRYSTIVTGIRAYQTRKDLKAHHQRVLDYVRTGGHLVVQYNKYEFNVLVERPNVEGFTGSRPDATPESPFAPYPAAVTGNRVTLDDAPVEILVPAHPLLQSPNRIGAPDFAGWVQERGLYFLGAKDARYTELLASSDPFPKNPGRKAGLLTEAKVGKGTWTYVGLGLWRQLPAGTPGAYRLLANLLSRPRVR
jgi:LmbE family N-acetylglucosaminyl deacetylase